jgi:hypothetical protein
LLTAEVDSRELDERDPRGPFLISATYAIHSTFNTTLKATPGQVVFVRGMVLPINFVADWGGQLSNNTKRKWLVIIKDKMSPEKIIITK